MEERNRPASRRTFHWTGVARELIRVYLRSRRSTESRPEARLALKGLITRIAGVSENPRGACWRSVRQLGVQSKRSYRPWTKTEQQKLLDLIVSHPLEEVSLQLRRSPTSVRAMLHRLGANAHMGQDWFTRHALAEALHIRSESALKITDYESPQLRMIFSATLLSEDVIENCHNYGQDRGD